MEAKASGYRISRQSCELGEQAKNIKTAEVSESIAANVEDWRRFLRYALFIRPREERMPPSIFAANAVTIPVKAVRVAWSYSYKPKDMQPIVSN
jgi:hypothetical protein